ncbi:LPS translocon maturation chaperone LptM [Hydrogenophaga sp.]|uniref:LPS translocon maturation chaperone LptM n=1 Tax=Hydrogenophaga sp. TaxID=1904254 RepID=UPI0039FDCA87
MLDLHRILGAAASVSRLLALASLLGVGLLLVGCGQKGPLFLPTAPSQLQLLAIEPSSNAQPDHNETQAER